jgi:hypothetical protein
MISDEASKLTSGEGKKKTNKVVSLRPVCAVFTLITEPLFGQLGRISVGKTVDSHTKDMPFEGVCPSIGEINTVSHKNCEKPSRKLLATRNHR